MQNTTKLVVHLGPVLAISSILFGQHSMSRPQTYVYKKVGDCEIKADVYLPQQDGVRSAILHIHGGALIFGHRGGIRHAELTRYLQAGFVVVSIDYRLAPETKLAATVEDVEDAYRWVRQNGPALFKIDPNRVAVIGHSAGGYLTLMAGFRFQPRPKALVSFYGYGDIVGDWYSRPDPFYLREPLVSRESALAAVGEREISDALEFEKHRPFYLYCRQQGLWPKEVVGIDPTTGRSQFDRFCPVQNVTRDYPPTLLLHGDRDTDVPFEQSAQMARELKRLGVEHEFIPISGGGHGFDGNAADPQTVRAFERVMPFLDKHLNKP